MTPEAVANLVAWISEAGLSVTDETVFLHALCIHARSAGLALSRATVFVDTLHPIYEGQIFRWHEVQGAIPAVEYGRTEGEMLGRWQRSPFFHLVETGQTLLRVSVNADNIARFPSGASMLGEGATEYIACVTRFGPADVIGGLDCVYSSWATEQPGGFSCPQVKAIEQILPPLAMALKARALTRIARTLVETYLGRDAGRRVLEGSIVRGAVERISTALWMSDLREFTRLAEAASPDELIPFLDDYAELVIAAIHGAGGDVLKLIGDGTLAIFPVAAQALQAAENAISEITALSRQRADAGLPNTSLYLGLHVGDVFFGNIGSHDRMDFTVIGPAVNEVSRIAAMCHSLDQRMLISSAFAAGLGTGVERLVSVGRYALRGVGGAQHLYTLDPGA